MEKCYRTGTLEASPGVPVIARNPPFPPFLDCGAYNATPYPTPMQIAMCNVLESNLG